MFNNDDCCCEKIYKLFIIIVKLKKVYFLIKPDYLLELLFQ